MLDVATLDEVCSLVNNHFESDIYFVGGVISIKNGVIVFGSKHPFEEGDYVYIEGSRRNDGAYRYNSGNLTDEEFDGHVYLMSMPKDFIALVSEISEWKEKNKDLISGVFQSESFGGYSYSLDTSSGRTSIQGAFGSRLNRYRKI